jgi:hypothetical protein
MHITMYSFNNCSSYERVKKQKFVHTRYSGGVSNLCFIRVTCMYIYIYIMYMYMFAIIKLERHDIAETLLKLALNTNEAINQTRNIPCI